MRETLNKQINTQLKNPDTDNQQSKSVKKTIVADRPDNLSYIDRGDDVGLPHRLIAQEHIGAIAESRETSNSRSEGET